MTKDLLDIEMTILDEDKKAQGSKWSQLIHTVSDMGILVKERASRLVFEQNLGRSIPVRDRDRDRGGGTMNLLDPHETLQRSYGSISPSPEPPSSNSISPSPPYGGVPSGSGSSGASGSLHVPIQNRRRRRSGGSGGLPKYEQLYSLPQQSSSHSEMDYFANNPPYPPSPSAPPPPLGGGAMGGLTIPIINIEQDDNFLTVDSAFNFKTGALSSGFNSAPPSPAPTNGGALGGGGGGGGGGHGASSGMGSAFDLGGYDPTQPFTIGRHVKIGILMLFFVTIAGIITATNENVIHFTQISASSNRPYVFPLKLLQPLTPWYPILTIMVKGAFVPKMYDNFTTNRISIDVEKRDDWRNDVNGVVITERWELPIFSEKSIGIVPESMESHAFDISKLNWGNGSYVLVFHTNMEGNFPLSVSVKLVSQVVENGAIFGGAVIIGLYILIIFELVNRTLSAILAATTAIGILSIFDERPTTEEMVSWLDMETLILLFSMMVLVSILCETGFFDYCAYLMYKIANGQVWPMVTALCFFTAVVSAFLDNVTTILLMTPVTIRICEAMELNPVPVLISIVIFSNIGGACTPVGDPPNVIISNNPDVIKGNIDFATFTTHMMLGIIPVIFVAYLQLRLTFRSMKSLQFSEPYAVAELRREIEVWSRAADSLSSYSKDENHVKALLMSKVVQLKTNLKSKIKMGGQSVEMYKANLEELRETCRIRDWPLLIKCGFVLSTVIVLFFLHSVPELNLSMGWTALLGAVLLLILADPKDLEGILSRVEWSTLIFFSALFIVMEGVSRLGLLEWIGTQTENIIRNVNTESRLTVGILLILWVSGLASAFIDNIPFTTMMVKIVTRVASNLSLPLGPLIWALAFGTCLGGNGTLIGASANVVCAGVADQHGYRFSFMEYFRIGFPMMVVSLVVASGYLVICHSLLSWND